MKKLRCKHFIKGSGLHNFCKKPGEETELYSACYCSAYHEKGIFWKSFPEDDWSPMPRPFVCFESDELDAILFMGAYTDEVNY